MHLILILLYSMLCALSRGKKQNSTPFSRWFDDDDEVSSRIYGGEFAKKGEFPYIVSLQEKNITTGDYENYCGGIILSKRLILTAAHCIREVQLTRVVAGTVLTSDLSKAQVATGNGYFIHPSYKPTREGADPYDIAILIIDTPLKYTKRVRPVTLPPQGREPDGKCMVAGWGKFLLKCCLVAKLRKIELAITERFQCPKSIEYVTKNRYKWTFDQTMICSHEISKGARKGDSGGPVMCKDQDDKLYLAGIVSWGYHLCGNDQCSGSVDLVSVFAHVGYFYCFIREILLLVPDSKNIGGNTSASVMPHVKLPTKTKKICRSKSVNKTSHASETKLLACKDNGDKCDRNVAGDCCSGYCRLSLGRGIVCASAQHDDPATDPHGPNFSMEKFLFDKFLNYKGWVGAGWWLNNTHSFLRLKDAQKLELKELPALQDNIFITDTCCVKDKYILESQKQKCLRIELGIVQLSLESNERRISYVFETKNGMMILITEGLHEGEDIFAAWYAVNYWRADLMSAGW